MAIKDLTTYTELDPNGKLTVIANKITFAGASRQFETRVWFDYGVGAFVSGVDIVFEHAMTSTQQSGVIVPLMLSNIEANATDLFGVAPFFYISDQAVTGANKTHYRLRNQDSAGFDGTDNSLDLVHALRAVKYIRSGQTITVIIYTDTTQTTIADTMSAVAGTVIVDQRYHYATNQIYNGTTPALASGFIQNYDVGIVGVVANIPLHAFKRAR